MTPNEINFIKELLSKIEEKNEKISELQSSDHELQIIKIQNNFMDLLKKEQTSHAFTAGQLEELVSSLRKEGYINAEMRDKYNIVYDK